MKLEENDPRIIISLIEDKRIDMNLLNRYDKK